MSRMLIMVTFQHLTVAQALQILQARMQLTLAKALWHMAAEDASEFAGSTLLLIHTCKLAATAVHSWRSGSPGRAETLSPVWLQH